ncbi:hypothetical protein GP486_005329 [Trichoglossum hirsutum]|uniref:DEUBAD domain-containing protein n=1 Tax=Trichoglossum hirsutum TaxID=265104 RepID=A0A9P8L9G0_9PEZI|nr:hypothetical protein GP486_005329 [Trichoglossum hirsutum]
MARKAKSAASRKSARAKKASAKETAQEDLPPPTIDKADSKDAEEIADVITVETKLDVGISNVPHAQDPETPTGRPATATSNGSGVGSDFKAPARKDEGQTVNTKLPTSDQSSLQSSPLSDVPSGSLSQLASASESEPTSRQRSTRKRRISERYREEPESPVSAKGAKESAGPRKRAKPTSRNNSMSQIWSEKSLFEGTNSILASIDLVKLFNEPRAWDILNAEEKHTLAASFPANAFDGSPDNPDAHFRPGFLKYDNDWKSGIRMYQEDLSNGRYDPEWIRQAEKSMNDRSNGDFDAWKEKEYEEFWGQKQKMAVGVIAGESNKIKLETLVRNDVIQVGDIWVFSRSFNKGKKTGILVEKEATVRSPLIVLDYPYR